MSRRHRDITDYYLQTLAQQVSRKLPYISDYACNVYADKLAQLDAIIEEIDDPEAKEALQTARKILKRQGEALWFMQAGELTNLGAKLGSVIRESEWNPEQ